VWAAVEGLSERQPKVFLLRFVNEQNVSEIAGATGMSKETVKAQLSRGVRILLVLEVKQSQQPQRQR
jgi:RNA polymerase sigma-70 factor (ECF subfamily)